MSLTGGPPPGQQPAVFQQHEQEGIALTQKAREQAVLGDYPAALSNYETVIHKITNVFQEHARAMGNRMAVERWIKCKRQLEEEMDRIRQLDTTWKGMQQMTSSSSSSGGMSAKPSYGGGYNNNNRDSGEGTNRRGNSGGGILDDFLKPSGGGHRDSSARRLRDSSMGLGGHRDDSAGEEKDPDVWSPPARPRDSASGPGWVDGRRLPVNERGPRCSQDGPGQGGDVRFGPRPDLPSHRHSRAAAKRRPVKSTRPSVSSNLPNSPPQKGGRREKMKPAVPRYEPPRESGAHGGYGGGAGGAPSQGGGRGSSEGRKYNEDGSRVPYAEFLYGGRGDGPDGELIRSLERDCVENTTNVTWDSIAGCESAKMVLSESVILPIMAPDFFTGIRRPWKGVLLFGPPGTGKTMLARAVASQCQTTFMNVSASTLASKYRGDSEKLVRLMFDMAKYYAPTVIFFDEVDAVGGERGGEQHEASTRMKAELLIRMDGVHEETTSSDKKEDGDGHSPKSGEEDEKEESKLVMVLAATNRPWDLDAALRRRLEKRIYIPLPEAAGRRHIFETQCKDLLLDGNVNFDDLVKETEGYSGADCANLCREAAMMGIRTRIEETRARGEIITAAMAKEFNSCKNVPVTQKDFMGSIKRVCRSVGNEDLNKYAEWMAEFGAV